MNKIIVSWSIVATLHCNVSIYALSYAKEVSSVPAENKPIADSFADDTLNSIEKYTRNRTTSKRNIYTSLKLFIRFLMTVTIANSSEYASESGAYGVNVLISRYANV